MKPRHHIFRRENGIYYFRDTLTKKRHSLATTLLDEARHLIHVENETARQPAINLQITRACPERCTQEALEQTANTMTPGK
jgi:hypothetical protein